MLVTFRAMHWKLQQYRLCKWVSDHTCLQATGSPVQLQTCATDRVCILAPEQSRQCLYSQYCKAAWAQDWRGTVRVCCLDSSKRSAAGWPHLELMPTVMPLWCAPTNTAAAVPNSSLVRKTGCFLHIWLPRVTALRRNQP